MRLSTLMGIKKAKPLLFCCWLCLINRDYCGNYRFFRKNQNVGRARSVLIWIFIAFLLVSVVVLVAKIKLSRVTIESPVVFSKVRLRLPVASIFNPTISIKPDIPFLVEPFKLFLSYRGQYMACVNP
jgi:hypothetical protein